MVVQDRLAELYASLAPAQREVLDTILAAGMSLTTDDDTSGFFMVNSQFELESLMHDRVSTLREEWRQATTSADAEPGGRKSRWNFRPLVEWANRAQPRTV